MTPRLGPSRIASVLLCVGILASGTAATVVLLGQWSFTPPWFTLAVLTGILTALVLAVVGTTGRIEASWAARVLLASVALGLLLLPLVTPVVYPAQGSSWIALYLPVALAGSILVLRSPVASFALGLTVLAARAAFLLSAHSDASRTRVVADVVYNATVMTTALIVLLAVLGTQRDLDVEAGQAARSYARARTTEQLSRHDAQWDALIHDEVLAALESVSRSDSLEEARAARDAVGAAAHRLRLGPRQDAPDGAALREDLLAAVLTTYAWATTDFDPVQPGLAPVPGQVAQGLVQATAEALRNVAAHAYPLDQPGPATVRLVHTADEVRVVVADDGCGFRRDQVRPTSFGLALAIEDRMDTVGGHGSVHSVPGEGTRVELAWRPGRSR